MKGKVPLRQCMGCREHKPKTEFLRVVRSPQGEVTLDLTGKKPGRGVYVCKSPECLKRVIKGRAIDRSLSVPVPPEVLEAIKSAAGVEI